MKIVLQFFIQSILKYNFIIRIRIKFLIEIMLQKFNFIKIVLQFFIHL